MTSILLVTQVILAIVLTVTVLLQKSSSIGLGAYSGSNESVFGAKGPAGFLQKLTMALGLLFVVNTVALGYIYNQQNYKTVMDAFDSTKVVPDAPKALEGNTPPQSPPMPPSIPAIPEKTK